MEMGPTKLGDARSDALWALSYISDGNDERICAVVGSGVLEEIQFILGDCQADRSLLLPLVRILGNLVTGSPEFTEKVLRAGLLEYCYGFLHHPSVRSTA